MKLIRYKTAGEKWDQLIQVARNVLKERELANLCEKMYIRLSKENLEDEGYDEEVGFTIDSLGTFQNAVERLNPQCNYDFCRGCPLNETMGYHRTCCSEFINILGHLIKRMKEEGWYFRDD